MKPHTKTYKKPSKHNKKKKNVVESETGELSVSNSSKRFPIVSLPEITTTHIIQEYRRFVNNGGAVNGTLTITELFNQYMMAVSATSCLSYLKAIRIKKVRLLCPVTTQGTSVTCSMQPLASDSSSNNYNCVPEVYLDTSASIDIPAYLSITPSMNTPLGSWHRSINVSSSLLQITCPAGSTLDILFEFIITTDGSAPVQARTVAGATVGILYTANILTNFVPQGRAVI
jgi:hypothetical protein